MSKSANKDKELSSEAVEFLREMIAHRPGGANRPQQEDAVRIVEEAIEKHENALVQAGTGTGKSYAMLVPAALSGKRIVYSTATKQLSEQLNDSDIPALQKELRRQDAPYMSAALLKGRENYACKRKVAEITEQDQKPTTENIFEVVEDIADQDHLVETELFEKTSTGSDQAKTYDFEKETNPAERTRKEYQEVYKWLEKTETGDRSEAPPVSDKTWRGVSVTNNECVGKACPLYDSCFSESARMKAKKAQLVVTNHAVTALDLMTEGEDGGVLLGNRDVYIFDEIHELDNYLSSAWGTTLSTKMIIDTLASIKKIFKPGASIEKTWDDLAGQVETRAHDLGAYLEERESGLIWPNELSGSLQDILDDIKTNLSAMSLLVSNNSVDENEKTRVSRTVSTITESIEILRKYDEENVRWIKNPAKDEENSNFKRKNYTPPEPSLHAAPIRVGPTLQNALAERNATMIGTSATITVGGKFTHPVKEFALSGEDLEIDVPAYSTKDVGTPFDYARQAMLYIPDPETYPSAEYKTIREHSAAVNETCLNLTKSAGGRALILLTTTRRISEVGEYLKDNLDSDIEVLQQGDMPAPQLIDRFIKNETSVLVATMGMWHGLNAEGPTCMLVIMDKIPFPPMDDPLSKARQQFANDNGGNGFMDVYVATANVKLAQGFGRLIRTVNDKGVVALLDTRLKTKRYGSQMLRSLPRGVSQWNDEEVIASSLTRLREAREQELG